MASEWIVRLSFVVIALVILATMVTIWVLSLQTDETLPRSVSVVTLTMEGDIAQVTAEDKRKAVTTVARNLGVNESQVVLQVTSGSIVFRFTVTTEESDVVLKAR